MKKTKVLRIITRLNIGGPTLHVVNLCHGLQDEYETILVCGRKEEHETDMSYYAEQYQVPIIYLKNMSRELHFPADLLALWELFWLIKKEKPDIVHTHTAKAGTLGRIAAILSGVPLRFHTFHGNIFKGFFSPLKTKFFIGIERFLALFTTKIVAISEKQKQELIDFHITKPEKIVVIMLGFNFHHVLAQEEHQGLFRQKYHIPSDALLVAKIARITAIKNHLLFLDIAEKLANHHIYFVIVGDGDLREYIQKEIERRNLQQKVMITGFIQDLKPLYADIDVSMLTSKNEGTPVALIEAMANGKIVVSTNVGGIADFVENGYNGFFIDDFSPAPFAQILIDIQTGNIKSHTISTQAKELALRKFTKERLTFEVNQLYQGSKFPRS